MKENNVFGDQGSVEDFLSPGNVQPLVELPPEINPLHSEGVEIWAKIYGSQHIKFVTAIGMLKAAKQAGKLEGVHTLVEASSGNTVHALHIVKDWFGIKKVIPVIPRDIAHGKEQVIRLLGMDPVYHNGDGIAVAARLGAEPGCLNLNQYRNPANPAAHERWTGPQIFKQTDYRVRIFAAGLGTSGTMEGVSRFLRGQLSLGGITTVGVICKSGNNAINAVPGVRSREGLKQVGLEWEKWSDHVLEVTAPEAYLASLRMVRRGIPAGPSSGFALQGLINFLEGEKVRGSLGNYRGSDKKVVAAFICPDSPEKYLEKYSMALSPEALGSIENS